MSKLVTSSVVIGQSGTSANNFLLDTDALGTVRLRRNTDGSGATILQADSSNNLTTAGVGLSRMITLTPKATTSGTFIDYTSADGIPTWAKKITIMFNGISTNGANTILIRLGSGSIQSTGYISSVSYCGAGQSGSSDTSGFLVTWGGSGADLVRGAMTITNFGGNSNFWVSTNMVSRGDSYNWFTSGTVTLSGTLNMIRLTSINGTDVFDAGFINLMIEG